MKDYTCFNEAPRDSKSDSIETVTIEDGVTSIGSIAFSICSNIKKVTISEDIVTIGHSAFSNCSKIR